MLDYVAVNKEWIFSGVGFSVVVAIIFVVRSILNRRRSDGSISTRAVPAEIVRDVGKRSPVRRILPFLSIGYVIYALLIAWFICRLLFRVYRAQSAGQMQLSGIHWMPLAMTSVFCLRFHWHMSLPRIVPFSTALATRRVGACLHFVYLCSYRHDFRRTHDLCSHAPGGQIRVHVKRSNRAISLGLNPPCFAQAPLF